MKISFNFNAGLSLDDISIAGLTHHESQKNWDNDVKKNHGRERSNHTSLESIGGSAKANFDMGVSIDLQPEELKSCYDCIQELVKTVADAHYQTAEAVKETAEVVEKTADLSSKKVGFCFPDNRIIEKLCNEFFDISAKAHHTKNIDDIEQAIYLGNVVYNAFDDFGYSRERVGGTLADIKGEMNSLKEIRRKIKKAEATVE